MKKGDYLLADFANAVADANPENAALRRSAGRLQKHADEPAGIPLPPPTLIAQLGGPAGVATLGGGLIALLSGTGYAVTRKKKS